MDDGLVDQERPKDAACGAAKGEFPVGVAHRRAGAQRPVRDERAAKAVVRRDDGAVVKAAIAVPVVKDQVAEAQPAGLAGIAPQVDDGGGVESQVLELVLRQ